MDNVISLADLGPRICIIGPSNSGKSTLAKAIAGKSQFPVVHLDQLFHLPGTRWQQRPEEEFLQLHNKAIQAECWIIEGNYHLCLKARLERATGLILLDCSLPVMLKRYFYRTLFQRERTGDVLPENQRDGITGEMLKYLIFSTPQKRAQQQKIFAAWEQPKLYFASSAQLRAWLL